MYINREPVTVDKLVCKHPRVKQFWEYGSIDMHGVMYQNIGIITDDGVRHEFANSNPSEAVAKAEQFLATLN